MITPTLADWITPVMINQFLKTLKAVSMGTRHLERRAHPRFPILTDSSLTKCPHCPGLGPIIDISLGGLSFYHENVKENLNFKSIDIYFGNDLFCLKDLPCEKVLYNGHGLKKSPKDNSVKRIGIQFGELDSKQQKQLDYLIKLNSSFSTLEPTTTQ